MVDSIAFSLAVKLKKHDADGSGSVEILQYGITVIINFLITASALLILSLFFTSVTDMLFMMGGFIFLRSFTGGNHLSSFRWCFLFSTGSLFALTFMPSISVSASLALYGLGLALLLKYAPYLEEDEQKTAKQLRNKRIGVVLLSIAAAVSLAGLNQFALLGAVYQCLLISPYGVSMIRRLDRVLS